MAAQKIVPELSSRGTSKVVGGFPAASPCCSSLSEEEGWLSDHGQVLLGWWFGTKEGARQGVRAVGRRFMSFTVHLQSKTKIAETPVFCFIGSVNKHINFYDISGGLLKGEKNSSLRTWPAAMAAYGLLKSVAERVLCVLALKR